MSPLKLKAVVKMYDNTWDSRESFVRSQYIKGILVDLVIFLLYIFFLIFRLFQLDSMKRKLHGVEVLYRVW